MNVLVAGVPRSGTTWLGSVLGSTPGAGFVKEPDDLRLYPYAGRASRILSGTPVLRPGDNVPSAYVHLWDAAFEGRVRYVRGQQRLARALFAGVPDDMRVGAAPARGMRGARLRAAQAIAVPLHADRGVTHRVVKSVRVMFALDWVRARWDPTVVLCFRHPLDVVASRLTVHAQTSRMPASDVMRRYALDTFGIGPPPRDDGVMWAAWAVGTMMSALDRARERDPSLLVADHEQLCADPVAGMRQLVDAVGLEWSPEVERLVVESNRPGSGYELTRVAADQPGKWRTVLSDDEAERAREMLAQFPVASRYQLA